MHKEKYVGETGYRYALYISNILKYTKITFNATYVTCVSLKSL